MARKPTAPTPDANALVAGILIDEIADWLMSQALGETTVQDLFVGCCDRLRAADLPIARASFAFRTLHPMFQAITVLWRDGAEPQLVEHPHGPITEEFRRSPYYHLLSRNLPRMRRRLEGDAPQTDFPFLEELRADGVTDYLAHTTAFAKPRGEPTNRDGVLGSWTTKRPGGFLDAEIAVLRRIERRLAVAAKICIKEQIARNILDAYLGPHAGQRVYEGDIARGAGERIHAVIWFCDLRGSTELSREMPMEAFLAALNEFFECMADAVLDRGGEVLRFIGDAMLAIFPMEHHTVADPRECPVHQAACRNAVRAVRDAIARVAVLNERRTADGLEPLRFGIGLHVGDVMYGNIGAPRRVEFSVVGHAANQAAKMESLCKVLGLPLLVSGEFAAINDEGWAEAGDPAHGDGVGLKVFTLPELAPE